MFLTCIVILTPSPIIVQLTKFLDGLQDDKKEPNILIALSKNYIRPLIIVIFNSGIIPTICDIIANLEWHKKKSSRQVSIMRKNFFFQIMNTIFLQITLSTTIIALIEKVNNPDFKFDFDTIRTLLLSGFVDFLFINLSIQWTFISNGIQLLDIPHHIIKFLKFTCHKRAQKKDVAP